MSVSVCVSEREGREREREMFGFQPFSNDLLGAEEHVDDQSEVSPKILLKRN